MLSGDNRALGGAWEGSEPSETSGSENAASGRLSRGAWEAEAAQMHPRDSCCSRSCVSTSVAALSSGATPGQELDKPTALVGTQGLGGQVMSPSEQEPSPVGLWMTLDVSGGSHGAGSG